MTRATNRLSPDGESGRRREPFEWVCDLMVGAARFELATTCTPCRYATRLRYAPTPRKYNRGLYRFRHRGTGAGSAQDLDDVFQFLLECGDVDAACLRRTRGRARGRRGACRCGAQAFVEAIARAADGESLLV